jgi:hypothetical protein
LRAPVEELDEAVVAVIETSVSAVVDVAVIVTLFVAEPAALVTTNVTLGVALEICIEADLLPPELVSDDNVRVELSRVTDCVVDVPVRDKLTSSPPASVIEPLPFVSVMPPEVEVTAIAPARVSPDSVSVRSASTPELITTLPLNVELPVDENVSRS